MFCFQYFFFFCFNKYRNKFNLKLTKKIQTKIKTTINEIKAKLNGYIIKLIQNDLTCNQLGNNNKVEIYKRKFIFKQ